MTTDLGLQYDVFTLPLYLVVAVVWLGSLWLLPRWRPLRWRAIPMSLFGFVWAGFGLHFVIRFPLLCWDSFVFGNMTSRLADATSIQVNVTLILSGLYFACLAAAYWTGRSLLAKMAPIRLQLPAEHARDGQAWLSVLSLAAIVASSGYLPTPLSLLTVCGIFGTFWVIPAAFVWFERFRFGARAKTINCWLFLLPGLVRAILSPYRENLLMPVVVVVVAAGFAGRRIRLFQTAIFAVVILFCATVVVTGYRRYLWEDVGVVKAIEYAGEGYGLKKDHDSKWVEVFRRFHAFDSLLLTVRYVPEFIPHSHREVLFSALVRGLVPRAIYRDKEGSTRGLDFAQSIWSYEDAYARPSTAFITPSMPGDLFEAYGVAMVVVGGILWGIFVGLLEGWKERLSLKAAPAFIALFAFHFLASVERDYAHVISTTIQYLIVLFIAAKGFMLFGDRAHLVRPRILPRTLS